MHNKKLIENLESCTSQTHIQKNTMQQLGCMTYQAMPHEEFNSYGNGAYTPMPPYFIHSLFNWFILQMSNLVLGWYQALIQMLERPMQTYVCSHGVSI